MKRPQNFYTGGATVGQDDICLLALTAMADYGVAGFDPPGPDQWIEKRGGPLGCVFTVSDDSGAYAGLFVWRFGVLLAGDATAHRTIPALPIAPPRELAEGGGA